MLLFSEAISNSGCLHCGLISGQLQLSWLAGAVATSCSGILKVFQVRKKKGVSCSASAEKCTPGMQPCMVPRAPQAAASLTHPATAGSAASPKPGLPSSTSSDGTQLLGCSCPCVPCGMHSGLGWAGMGGCRTGQGRSCCLLSLLPGAAGSTLRGVQFLLLPLYSGLEPGGKSERREQMISVIFSSFFQALPSPLPQDLRTEAGGHQPSLSWSQQPPCGCKPCLSRSSMSPALSLAACLGTATAQGWP